MNNDFTSFELAIKLKEKGFPQHLCDYAYIIEENYEDIEREYVSFIPDYLPTVAAPTISQVLKWLRNDKKIYVSILPFATHSTINKVAFYYLISYDSTGETMEGIEQNTYCAEWKDAAFAGIEYVLDNLI